MEFSFSRKYNVLIICILACTLYSCRKKSFHTYEGIMWNTSYHITYESEDEFTDSITSAMLLIDSTLSPFNPNSAVSTLNNGDSIRLTPMLHDVLAMSQQVWKESSGHFDPTAGPLINAYGFGPKQEITILDSTSIREILSYVGMDKIMIRNNVLIKPDRRMQFNFSALAKGYGCDCVAAMLARRGVRNYMVEIGGEIVVAGKSPRGDNWHISVDKPIESTSSEVHESQIIIALSDCAVATSGNYRNFRDKGSTRIGHIVDPTSGLPSETDVASATVIAHDCMTADAYATALMSMPADEAIMLAKRLKLSAYLILKDGNTWTSQGFERFMLKN